MPMGKPAGIRCVQLDENNMCRLFGDPRRPDVCHRFDFDIEVCGESRESAIALITELEHMT